MRLRRLLLIVPLALSACAGGSGADRDSPDYAAGYSDGCSTGSAADSYPRGRTIRDDHAFRHNPDYKAGWRSGYNACLVRSGHEPLDRDRF